MKTFRSLPLYLVGLLKKEKKSLAYPAHVCNKKSIQHLGITRATIKVKPKS